GPGGRSAVDESVPSIEREAGVGAPSLPGGVVRGTDGGARDAAARCAAQAGRRRGWLSSAALLSGDPHRHAAVLLRAGLGGPRGGDSQLDPRRGGRRDRAGRPDRLLAATPAPGFRVKRSRTPRRAPSVVGVDTGGTFTDFVARLPSGWVALKVPSTSSAPERAVLDGLARLRSDRSTRVRHGSTVATNTLLERKGARVVLLTNRGFEDLLEIGRQERPELYALAPRRVP